MAKAQLLGAAIARVKAEVSDGAISDVSTFMC